MKEYSIIEPGADGYYLDTYQGYDDDWELAEGYSLSSDWSDDISISARSESGQAVGSDSESDFLRSVATGPIVSEKVKGLLEAEGVEAEFLPVKVTDHKQKVLGSNYYVLNVLTMLDAIDLDKTAHTVDSLDDSQIELDGPLQLDTSKVPDSTHLFRLEKYNTIVIASSELIDKLQDNGVSNVKITKLEDYTG